MSTVDYHTAGVPFRIVTGGVASGKSKFCQLLAESEGGHHQSRVAEHLLRLDERLREKEFGILDRLTAVGISEHYPDQAQFRKLLGKFYHRPPGGESWCDVILRLRSATEMITREYCGQRVLIVCHAVVVLCMRYILEELTEQDILRIDKDSEILNCGIVRYDFKADAEGLCIPSLAIWNHGAPMEEQGTIKTAEPDMMTGSR